jgi:predicted Zn-dependent peptidase
MAKRQSVSDAGVFRKTVLKNGLRVLTEKMPSVRSISLGVWVDIGSRNETGEENGMSHLVEHMLFKGTRRRSAKEIAASLEFIGGSLNAFTSKEQTCYVARVLDEHLDVAVDVISDMMCHSTFTPVNLKREKQVICEEIKESVDTPSEHIYDIFAETFWGARGLGRPTMGTMESVTKMPRRNILDYVKRNYRTNSIVVAASGYVSHRQLVDLVTRKFRFAQGAAPDAETSARDKNRNIRLQTDDNNQTHLCLGFPGVKYAAAEKMPMLVLNLYLGGGMSSVLFQMIREERGLAYSVYSFTDFYRDCGLLGAYLGTDRRHLSQAVDIVLREFNRMKSKRLPAAKLAQVKTQLKGNIMLGMESTSNRMNRLARQELAYGEYFPLERTMKEIDRVTSSDILELANRVFDDSQMAIAVLGPVDKNALDNVR